MIAQMLQDLIARGYNVKFSTFSNYHNAQIILKNGITVSIGYGAGHYCSNRFATLDAQTALLGARTAEVSVFKQHKEVAPIVGYASSRKIRAAIRKWEKA